MIPLVTVRRTGHTARASLSPPRPPGARAGARAAAADLPDDVPVRPRAEPSRRHRGGHSSRSARDFPRDRLGGVEWWLSRMWTHDVRVDFFTATATRGAARSSTGRERASPPLVGPLPQPGARRRARRHPPASGSGESAAGPASTGPGDLLAPRPNRFALVRWASHPRRARRTSSRKANKQHTA